MKKTGLPPPASIRELLPYRLRRAVFYATKPSYLRYGRDFEVTGVEWRLMGNLFTDGALSVAGLADAADIPLPQASRSASTLVGRGLVSRRTDEADARSVRLALTPEGVALYERLFAQAVEDHEALLCTIPPEHQRVLFDVLETIAQAGRALLDEERTRTGR